MVEGTRRSDLLGRLTVETTTAIETRGDECSNLLGRLTVETRDARNRRDRARPEQTSR